jgi:hypothetical protein
VYVYFLNGVGNFGLVLMEVVFVEVEFTSVAMN